ncbi:MAG: ASCH domain-containing protein [Gemmataceae bacterium]|nr:ASCH domain-containing protein [Gemmataceae bacterium]
MKGRREYALSVKQPWATLLVRGIKTVEVRSWPTARQGRVLIHASTMLDERPEVWDLVPEELRSEARELTGGIVGAGELTGCVAYRSVEAFAADQERHLNDPSWFAGPVLYGFTFSGAVVLPFRHYPGWVRFFAVEAEAPRRKGEGSRRAK